MILAGLGVFSLGLGALIAPTTPAQAAPSVLAAAITPAVPVAQNGQALGAITGVSTQGNAVTLQTERGALRVTFLSDDVFRVEGVVGGHFKDPANTPQGDASRTANIVVGLDEFPTAAPTVTEGDVVTLATGAVTLEIVKADGKMTLKRADGTIVWAESRPTTYSSSSTTQYLAKQELEQFVGGGMQNGRTVHTDQTINVTQDTHWEDGDNPNAVPYYMSSRGYGVLRNTFAGGTYDFKNEVTTTHGENRFDAYYFVGGFKTALDGYTKLTGRPLMPPVYALEYGDADCYNRSNPAYQERNPSWATMFRTADKLTTPDAAKIAKELRDNDLPTGWMLVNDGYSCEYTQLPETVTDLQDTYGIETGLWTQRSLTNQEYEVQDAGISMRKLDVAWVGSGYRMALTGCEAARDGIEQYSNRRGLAIMVEGWAGAQRCGMQWTGDHAGTLDAIRWQISALAGSGMSGQAFTLADVDGIFGGSEKSYVRDLQWKAFAPALYSMSGWTGGRDKRPYDWGVDAESTEINRKYLYERQQLMPYIYTLAEEAHRTGTPVMRHLALEYPDSSLSYGTEANTQYLLGQDLLVAPVYSDTDVRNGIALPEGKWIDYWTGDVFDGNTVRNGHSAPLDTLPLFVRAGAVIPYAQKAFNSSEVPADAPITLHVYPQGESSFTLYEDDGRTRDFKNGAESRQTFTVTAPEADDGDVAILIGERQGNFDGMAAGRPYEVVAHTSTTAQSVLVDGTELREITPEQWDDGQAGWLFAADETAGVIKVRIETLANGAQSQIELLGTSAVGGADSDANAARLSVETPEMVVPGVSAMVVVPFHNSGQLDKRGVKIELQLPEGWEEVSSYGAQPGTVAANATSTAQFIIRATGAATAGEVKINAATSYLDRLGQVHSISATGTTQLAHATLQNAYNFVSVTSIDNTTSGNFDGGGASFADTAIANALAGSNEVSVPVEGGDTATVIWPAEVIANQPNSMSVAGQTVSVSGQGTHLALLGSAASASGVSPAMTLHYTDGTTSTAQPFFPNWLYQSGPGMGGSYNAIASMGRHNTNTDGTGRLEYDTYTYRVYMALVPLDSGKELQSVSFGQAPLARIFAWNTVDLPNIPKPDPGGPTEDGYLSDIPWVSGTTGWGQIGIDVANKDSASSPDVKLKLGTTEYDKGLGVHAVSELVYNLGGNCTTFKSDVGLETGWTGTVRPEVKGDGTTLFEGSDMKAADGPATVEIDVTGVKTLTLLIKQVGSSIGGAHAVWGNARLEGCSDPGEIDPVLPQTELALDPPAANGENGWYRQSPVVSLTPAGTTPGEITNYRFIENGLWQSYSAPFALPDGSWEVEYYTYSSSGTKEATQVSSTIKVDTVAPRVWGTVDTEGREALLFAEDEGSGLNEYLYSLDGGTTWTPYDGSGIPASTEEAQTIHFYATDNAGNTSIIESIRIPAEATPEPPVTQLSVTGGIQGNDQWYIEAPQLTLAVISASAPIDSIWYSVDGETTWKEYVGPVDLPDGVYSIYHYAVDEEGREGQAMSSSEFRVDTTPPVVDAEVDAERRMVTITATDATSGIASIEYSLDSGESWVPYADPVVAGSGAIELWARATDNAGNISEKTGPFELDEQEVTAPVAPTGVSIDTSQTTHNSMEVSWDAVEGADSYIVSYWEDPAGEVQTVETAETAATLSGLEPGTSYSVSVQAKNAAGESESSAVVAGATLQTPDAVPGQPQNLVVVEKGQTSARIAWDVTPGADSYLVYYGIGGETPVEIPSVGPEVELAGLQANTEYSVTVKAVNQVGQSEESEPLIFSTDGEPEPLAPATPTGLAVSATTPSSLTLTWDRVQDATEYRVSVTDGQGVIKSMETSETTLVFGELESDTEYSITVSASNQAGSSPQSEPVIGRTLPVGSIVPVAPTGLTVLETKSDTVSLAWNPVVGAEGYRVDYTMGTRTVTSLTVTTTSATITGLQPETNYMITVTALSAAGDSDPSEPLMVQTLKAGTTPDPDPDPAPGPNGGNGGKPTLPKVGGAIAALTGVSALLIAAGVLLVIRRRRA